MSPVPVYIPGKRRERFIPLERYLPPIPEEIGAVWLRSKSLQGKFVLDPFGASPDLSVEAARNGTHLIVAVNNPVNRLLIEATTDPPSTAEIRTVLAALAAARIRDERLELHINALYYSNCPNCNTSIEAHAFIWEREAQGPHAKIIECLQCNTAGEFPTTAVDLQHAAQFKQGGLHYARALERVAPLHDPDRIHVEEALNVYPPRAVYALLTIINKLDALNLSPRQERILAVLLLTAFDRANTLWPYPVERERPRQLTIPPVYRENNIWLALEQAASKWNITAPPVALSYWPELPPEEGGVCLYEGRIKDLAAQLSEIDLSAVLTAFPRPNQAFWSLSALWAGWIWGPEGVDHFKSVLRRRRYDWAWHTTASQNAMESLNPALPKDIPILGLIGEAEPGFVAAITNAAAMAGWHIEGLALNEKEKQIQIHWRSSPSDEVIDESKISISDRIIQAAQEYLQARGEPSGYLPLCAAIMLELARNKQFPETNSATENYTELQQEVQAALNYRNGFLRYGGSEKSLEVGHWWLNDASAAAEPLADRVEMAVVQQLVRKPSSSLDELEIAIFEEFPGLPTPAKALICECLESYGEETETGWHLREQDIPQNRRAELASMGELIAKLGKELGFGVQSLATDNPQYLWIDNDGVPRYAFYISASGLLGKFLANKKISPARGIIVLPGGRANLVMLKLRNDPRLRQIIDEGWQFLKYRQARQLANNPTLTAESLEVQIGLDPLTYNETQLRMF